jgi:arylsulfatase A-like enzyme
MIDMNQFAGRGDILLMTLDSLRWDAAERALAEGLAPNLAALLPGGRWEKRHAPGSFTYASHQAMFAGFFPTPARPGKHPRPFALRFAGSETTAEGTLALDAPNIVEGLAGLGYRTACVGGVGFFNKRNQLGRVLPGMFQESWWEPRLGVAEKRSAEFQFELAAEIIARTPPDKRLFLFVNVSAIHQPNRFYMEGAAEDSPETHLAALAYVDSELPRLLGAMRRRGCAWFCAVGSDHGEAYGEDGFQGHRLGHPAVWEVPWAEFLLT